MSASTPTSDRVSHVLERLDRHDHVCLLYGESAEQLEMITPFIRIGLQRGERCLYIVDDNTKECVRGCLREHGIDVDQAVACGRLCLLDKHDTYLQSGRFEPQMMIDLLIQAAKEAKSQGHSGLRATGEMTWALDGDVGTDRLMEYEARLNEVFDKHDVLAVCQYNLRRFAPSQILDVIRTHPIVIHQGRLCRNFYYVPPEEFLRGSSPECEMERLIRNIREREDAEEALRHSRERYRAMLEAVTSYRYTVSVSDGAVAATRHGPGCLAVTGYEPADYETDRMLWLTMIHPEDRKHVLLQVGKILAGEFATPVEHRITHRDGSIRWVRSTMVPFRRRDGALISYDGLVEDITDRKRAEEALRESEARHRRMIETAEEGIWILDENDRITFVNDHMAGMLGYAPEEMKGSPVFDFVNAETQAIVRAALARRRQGVREHYDLRLRHKDGSKVWVIVSASPVLHRDGSYAGVFAMITDITRRKLAEQALERARDELEDRVAARTADLETSHEQLLREMSERRRTDAALRDSERRYQSLVEASPAILYCVDAATNEFLLVDGAVEAMLGFPAETLYADNDRATRMVHPEDRQLLSGAYTRGLASLKPFEVEVRLIRDADGREIWVHARVVPVADANGRLVRQYGVVVDVTDRKRAEEALRVSLGQLRQAERLASVGILSAGIAHEVNNPVGMILLAAQTALKARTHPDGERICDQSLHSIIDNAKRCGQIVRSLLQFSRQEPAEKWPASLNTVVEHSLLLTRRYCEEHHVVVRHDLARDLPEIVLNPLGIEQVVVNLLRNAVEASDPGSCVTVRTRLTDGGARLIVEDTGRGMTLEQRKHLFDPFYTTRLEKGGTGLGLSIVHGIIAEHGGTIQVESQPGLGTTLTIDLPRGAVPPPQASRDQNTQSP